MNWFSLFYWMTVADGFKEALGVFSNIFIAFSVISFIIFVVMVFYSISDEFGQMDESDKNSFKYLLKCCRRFFWYSAILMVLTELGWILTPSKKDALIIIAGGAVGNFVTND